jgi:uncharacterized protein with HEPN domain
MSLRDDLTRLRDMIEHAELAMDVSRDRSEGNLTTDRHLRAACERYVMIIGEAATHISEGTRQLAPDLPWRQIIATRNIVVHGYAQVRADILWSILSEHLPRLVETLRPIADAMDSDGD